MYNFTLKTVCLKTGFPCPGGVCVCGGGGLVPCRLTSTGKGVKFYAANGPTDMIETIKASQVILFHDDMFFQSQF